MTWLNNQLSHVWPVPYRYVWQWSGVTLAKGLTSVTGQDIVAALHIQLNREMWSPHWDSVRTHRQKLYNDRAKSRRLLDLQICVSLGT